MLAVVGTVPEVDFPLIDGQSHFLDDRMIVDQTEVEINRGTPALLAAAFLVSRCLDRKAPYAFLVGDIGLGHGSRKLYSYLADNITNYEFRAMVFHYLQPDVDDHTRVLLSIEKMAIRPWLIADAGFMYAAKMSGQSSQYDLFTPDIGELAFLADENAPHPFYTRGFILADENKTPDLISRAYKHENAAQNLLVKGEQDYIVNKGKIVSTVNQPCVEALEAVGGTGDTLTGIVSALIESGLEISQAGHLAAQINRQAGFLAKPDPASQITDIIRCIPQAFEQVIGCK